MLRKAEEKSPFAPEKMICVNVYDQHLGPAAYAAISEVPENKAEKEVEEQNFQVLYGEEKRITSFPKSPNIISIKFPNGIQNLAALNAKINQLTLSGDPKNELTTLKELKKQHETNQAFQAQFDRLIGALTAWALAAKGGVNISVAAENLEYFRANLFTDSFAGNQSSLYFEDLKYLLEKFYLYYLCDQSIPDDVKAKKFNGLLPNLIVCGPGAHTHLQDDVSLAGEFSLEASLASMKTLIIERLASKYIWSAGLLAGNEIHVKNSYLKLAKNLGLNPVWKEAIDTFHINTRLDERSKNDFFTDPDNRHRRQFERDFKEEFSYEKIADDMLERLLSALHDAIKTEIKQSNQSTQAENKKREAAFKQGTRTKLDLIPELKMQDGDWPINSTAVMNVVSSVLKLAGIELDEEFLDYRGNYARFKKKELRDQLMMALMKKGIFKEGMLFQGKIYFYQDYVPEENAMIFAERVQKAGMAAELGKLNGLPEPVSDEMQLRLIEMQQKGLSLLSNHIKLKLGKGVITRSDVIKEAEEKKSEASASAGGFFAKRLEPADNVWQRVVYGKEEGALQMLRGNHRLVEEKATVVDYSGREVDNATPFQAALRAGDDIMAYKIKIIYLEHNPRDGQAVLNAQFNEVFPDGCIAHLETQTTSANNFERNYLNPLVDAITNASDADLQAALNKRDNGSALSRALTVFKNEFDALSRREKVFNPCHLQKVFAKYDKKFNAWYHPDWSRLDLFWRQVIGWEERYLPANYAQQFCVGLTKYGSLPRKFKFSLRNSPINLNFFPLDADPSFQLGSDFAIYSINGAGCGWLRGMDLDDLGAATQSGWILLSIRQEKAANLERLCSQGRGFDMRPGVSDPD
ncbi:MAG TPA: hypothetical protein VLI69_07265 [Gammaproteobacteria bacterium]|nr:hypothetical protein [Gammaproteobacteria bacterium]